MDSVVLPAHPAPTPRLEDLIGGTPLVALPSLLGGLDGPRVLAKLESRNPGGSAKDRTAATMVAGAIRRGDLLPGDTIVESSSGNLGVALAQQAAWHGMDFVCVVDPRTPEITRRLITAYGGRVHLITEPDAATGDWLPARLAAVRALLAEHPRAWWPNQYANPDNPRAHSRGTIREILAEAGEHLSAVYVATSTTGTLVGCQDGLRAAGSDALTVAVDAEGSVLFGGRPGPRHLPGAGAAVTPALAGRARPDLVLRVDDLDCVVGCRRLARSEGYLAGASAGGVITALERTADRFSPADTVVVVLPDGGERYLDTVYDDGWVHETLGCPPDRLAALVEGGRRMPVPR